MNFFKALVAVTTLLAAVFGVSLASASPSPVSNVHVTVKGKRYTFDGVTTVEELEERIEEKAGTTELFKNHKILHHGKRLRSGESLSDLGVSDGDQLSCVPASSTKKKSNKSATTASKAASSTAADSSKSSSSSLEAEQNAAAAVKAATNPDPMAGIGEMLKGMGMGGAGAGGMPDPAESIKMMKEMTNSPLFSQYMNDPEKLEESRQLLLNNPMMKSMMSSIPGMVELIEDKDAWAQTMMQAATMMKDMDPDDIQKLMETQQQAMGGLFGGGDGAGSGSPSTPSALDELSEDD